MKIVQKFDLTHNGCRKFQKMLVFRVLQNVLTLLVCILISPIKNKYVEH